jgi:L-lactate dehydrogenase
VIGEHGTSEVFLWSGARVGGMRADQAIASQSGDVAEVRQAVEQEVRYANITIIEGIGASQLGIGMVSARIAEIVLGNEQAVVPIGVFNPKFGVTLSLPGVLGRSGVSRILEPAMTEGERRYAQSGEQADRRVGRRLAERGSTVPGVLQPKGFPSVTYGPVLAPISGQASAQNPPSLRFSSTPCIVRSFFTPF